MQQPPRIYKAFDKQAAFHLSESRIRGAFAGKRSGKSESCAVESLRLADEQKGYVDNGIDPFLGIIMAPTSDMLRRLSLAKFLAYAKPFIKSYHRSHQEIVLNNGSMIQGISADKPQRLEGAKAHWIWIDEVFQVSEQLFLEALARVSDTQGRIIVTGSLGVQYTNPKAHWVYKYFKDKPINGSEVFEWGTADNPYYPKEELIRLRETLDPVTFRQMFTITWDTVGTGLVYETFDEANVLKDYHYDKKLPTFVSVDWGYAHPMAIGFFQYDPRNGRVYLFDEIISSRMTLESAWDRIISKGYRIDKWFCDISGNQEREQTGYSNIKWFRDTHDVHFDCRSSRVQYGIAIVRMFIQTGSGQRKFYVYERNCPKSLDCIKNYHYKEKDGMILDENPEKIEDDAADMIRYFFVNKFDPMLDGKQIQPINRWDMFREKEQK
jgi:hypothetical protein